MKYQVISYAVICCVVDADNPTDASELLKANSPELLIKGNDVCNVQWIKHSAFLENEVWGMGDDLTTVRKLSCR